MAKKPKTTPKKQKSQSVKPFLKWAGGKAQLLKELHYRLPPKFGRYFEPFLGGGALFFSLQPKQAFLSDNNAELINAFSVVRDKVRPLIKDLQQHAYDSEYYYQIRRADQHPEFSEYSDVQRASRTIYLNKTCFNGLYRVNARGHFNVPFGKYSNPTIADESNLLACSKALKNVRLSCSPYTGIEQQVKRGDFVYFDPPYAPSSKTANFTAYTKGGFGAAEQKKLRDLCQRLDRKGVLFMLTNSHTPLIEGLYMGFDISLVRASRAINSNAKRRGLVNEVVITNY